jgi:hypothetical protein
LNIVTLSTGVAKPSEDMALNTSRRASSSAKRCIADGAAHPGVPIEPITLAYKCPLCGRIVYGRYQFDGTHVGPICTGAESDLPVGQSCFDKVSDGSRCNEIVEDALVDVFCGRFQFATARLIVSYLLGEEW